MLLLGYKQSGQIKIKDLIMIPTHQKRFFYSIVVGSIFATTTTNSMAPEISQSIEEKELSKILQQIKSDKKSPTLTVQEKKELTDQFARPMRRNNIKRITDWIEKNNPQDLSESILFLNSNKRLPLLTLKNIIEFFEYPRSRGAISIPIGMKFEDYEEQRYAEEYKGQPFKMNQIPSLDNPELSVYSQYLELPKGIREALEKKGYVQFQEVKFTDELKLKEFLTQEYQKIPLENITVNVGEIIKLQELLSSKVEKSKVDAFINKLDTTGKRFLLLMRMYRYYLTTSKPYLLSDNAMINLFKLYPIEIQKALFDKGIVKIITN